MVFKNEFFNSHPCVLHNPTPHYLWDVIVTEFFKTKKKKLKLHNNLTIITWSNNRNKSILEDSLEHLGLKCVVLGKNIQSWNNLVKIYLTKSILPTIKTDFVMGIDAFDAIVLDNPSRAIDLLDFYNAEMVFNATCGTAYSSKKLVNFCNREFSGPMRHLNAGAWIARTEFCREFFDKLAAITFDELVEFFFHEEFPDEPPPNIKWCSKSEQLRVKFIFEKLYPHVTIDHKCQIFQVINKAHCTWGDNHGVAITKKYL